MRAKDEKIYFFDLRHRSQDFQGVTGTQAHVMGYGFHSWIVF
jgi:hypothetical protein